MPVQSPVLVVELELHRLEGTQLRALGLLAVFGFNMMYAARAPGPGPTSCSAVECRMLGHCYASRDYQEFFCTCFEGYSGADCGAGPLCARTLHTCHNGGTCRQVGPAAVSCVCAPEYTGDLCEAQTATPECGIEECSEGCGGGACDCSPRDSNSLSARFETRLQVVDQGYVNISQETVKLLTSYLKTSNNTLEDDRNLAISSLEAGVCTVWTRIWSARKEAGAVRAVLARLVATPPRNARLRLLPASAPLHFHMRPALMLHESAEYCCQVSSVAGTSSQGMAVWALGPSDEVCAGEPSHGLRWPKTAAGAHATADCPPGFSGETTSVWHVCQQYAAVVRVLPGAAALPLQYAYLLSSASRPSDRVNSVDHLLEIFDS